MNPRISSHEDYLNELRHQFSISTGERQKELRELIFKEISDKYEHDHPQVTTTEVVHDHDLDFIEEQNQRDLDSQRYETQSYNLATGDA